MKSFRHLLTFVAGVCLVAAVVFGPLAFGSVEPWAYAILATFAFTALAATLMHDIVSGKAGAALSPLAIIGCAALFLVALQLIPLPAGLLGTFQPGAMNIHARTAAALDEPLPGLIVPSLYPHATRVSLIKLGAYVALFAAAYSYITSRRRLSRLAVAIVASGFVASLVGILQNLSGTREIFWLRAIRSGALFGPFVSRNQFAAYAGICMFTGIGLLLAKGGYSPAFIRKRGKTRKMPSAHPAQNILLGFVVAIMGASVIWSLSRGGIISAFLAGAAVIVAMIAARYFSGGKIYLIAALLLTLGFVTWFGWPPVVERLSTLGVAMEDPVSIDRFRYAMWEDAWRMGLDFPALGTGAGAYLSVSPGYRTFPGEMVARNPHNEYLSILAETGFVGLLLLLLALGLLLARIFKALRVREDPYTLEFLAGGVGGVFMVAFHSVVDFPLRSPGIVATLVVLCAMLYRLAVLERKKKRPAVAPNGQRARDANSVSPQRIADKTGVIVKPERGTAILGVVFCMVVFVGWVFVCRAALNELQGQIEGARIARATDKLTPSTSNARQFAEASLRSIKSHSPVNADLRADLADFARRAAETLEYSLESLVMAEMALDLRLDAAALEPANAEHRFHIASDYLVLGRADLAWRHARLAADMMPTDPYIRTDIADMFFAAGQDAPAFEMLEEAEKLARERNLEDALGRIRNVKRRRVDVRGM